MEKEENHLCIDCGQPSGKDPYSDLYSHLTYLECFKATKAALEAAQKEAEELRVIGEKAKKWHNAMRLYRETIELLKKSKSVSLYLERDRLWDIVHKAQEELLQALARIDKEG